MGDSDRPNAGGIRDAFPASHEGVFDLQSDCNLRAIQILLGHSKIENTVHYLGVDVDDALALSEATEI